MILITTAGQVLYTPGLPKKSLPRSSGYEYVSILPKLRPTLWDGAVAALVATLAIVTALCFYGRRTGAPPDRHHHPPGALWFRPSASPA